MSALSPCIELSHVHVAYPGSTREALCDVSLSVHEGEYVCILGGNGSGKSTLLKLIGARVPSTSGTVRVMGISPLDPERALSIRRQCASVSQNPEDQIVASTVLDDVAFGPENLCVPHDALIERVHDALDALDLADCAQRDPDTLSGGQQQRVAIAGALAMHPRVLLLDEPGAMLDESARRSLRKAIRIAHDRGITVVHVTHHMDDAVDADRVIVLQRGHVALDGAPSHVFRQLDDPSSLGLDIPFALKASRALHVEPQWTISGLAEEVSRSIASDGARGPLGRTPGGTGSASVPADETAIALDSVSFYYGYRPSRWRRRPTSPRAVDGVSCTVPRGRITALVGKTGSGKSTLLELICALRAPSDGSILVDGISTADGARRRELRERIGLVSQMPERQLFADTVREDVAFGPRNLGLDEDEVDRRTRDSLTLVGLDPTNDLLESSPFALSGGQQRSVALAGVLAMHQPILVLDEPMAGLDPMGRQRLRTLMRTLSTGGTTILFVTHNMDDVAALADHVIALDRGRIACEGSPAQVFDSSCRTFPTELGLPSAVRLARELFARGIELPALPLTLADLEQEVTRRA